MVLGLFRMVWISRVFVAVSKSLRVRASTKSRACRDCNGEPKLLQYTVRVQHSETRISCRQNLYNPLHHRTPQHFQYKPIQYCTHMNLKDSPTGSHLSQCSWRTSMKTQCSLKKESFNKHGCTSLSLSHTLTLHVHPWKSRWELTALRNSIVSLPNAMLQGCFWTTKGWALGAFSNCNNYCRLLCCTVMHANNNVKAAATPGSLQNLACSGTCIYPHWHKWKAKHHQYCSWGETQTLTVHRCTVFPSILL